MKKSLLTLGAACVAVSTMAITPKEKQQFSAPRMNVERNIELSGKFNLDLRRDAAMKKAPLKLNSPDDVITSAEGKRQDYTITGSGYYVFMDWFVDVYEDMESASHIIYGEDNDVYIYNIMPNLPTESYVKGVKEGDKIIVDLPQTILWDEYYQDGVNATIAEYTFDEETGEELYVPVEGGASLVLSIAEDGTMVAEGLDVERTLSINYVSDDYWSGYCAWSLSFAPFNETAVAPPSDIEVSEDFFGLRNVAAGYGWPVSFAQGGEEVYFQGLCQAIPEAWVKATVEYDDTEAHLYIDQNQYIGVYAGSYIYTRCAQTLFDEEWGYEYYELLPDDYKYELIWDYEAETIMPKDPSVSLLFNVSGTELLYAGDIYDYVLAIQGSFEGTPANPVDLYYMDGIEDYGYSIFEFYLPGFSTDGDVLITSDLSYVVYVDGEPWTFDAYDYEIKESMEEIPWDFGDYWIMKWDGSSRHAVAFFVEGISTVGVQTIYRYNGEETRSEIVTINVDGTSGVAGVDAAKKVADVKFFDLTGREVKNPANGVFVKCVTFDDGTVAASKQAVR